jgi:hypothetical protein
MSIRSVISGMLRRSSEVRIGPSWSRHRIVPFHRPSMTVSAVSIGHSLTPFFDTATRRSLSCQICQYLVFCQHSGHGRSMREIIEMIALVIAGPMVGVEIAVGAFTNPGLARLPDDAFRQARSDSGRVLGKVMPFWYIATLVALIAAAVVTRGWLIAAAAAVMAVIVLMTVTLMVPINNRIGRWTDAADRNLARRWDRLHWLRIALLLVMVVLLATGITE